jgi:phospholipid/cholesterol/gamma-HCH transport system substrate-binding protein
MSQPSFLFIPPEIGYSGHRIAKKRRSILVFSGLFVLLMLIILMASLSFFFGDKHDRYSLTTTFVNIMGVEKGTTISLSGVLIGQVQQVDFFAPNELFNCIPTTNKQPVCQAFVKQYVKNRIANTENTQCFKVTMRIDKQWKIPNDSFAIINNSNPLKNSELMIQIGSSDKNYAVAENMPGCGIKADLFSNIARLFEDVTDILQESIPMMASINRQIQAMELILTTNETDYQAATETVPIAGVFFDLRNISQKLNKMLEAINEQQMTEILTSAQGSMNNVEKITTSVSQRMVEMQSFIAEYQQVATEINQLLAKSQPAISGSLAETHYITRELANRLKPILTNLDAASRNIRELTRDIKENPAVIITGKKRFSTVEP